MNEHVPTASATATPGNRAKVFVSYSRKDLAFAQMMVGALAKLGFDAFLDKMDIAPGEPWKERFAALIATADTVVFTVSPDWSHHPSVRGNWKRAPRSANGSSRLWRAASQTPMHHRR